MTFFNRTVSQEIIALVRQRYFALGEALGEISSQNNEHTQETWTLQQDLTLLIDVANGKYQRTDELAQEVEQALTHLRDILLGTVLHSSSTYPEEFWQTEIGIVVSRARWWISVDELITISNAAALAFGENTQANRMRIARAIENGSLEWVPDPSIANPQQNKRVLRSQVERFCHLSRLSD
ncbi:hypothetical protein [Tengunoibacter tsumagoiensis]|uniref:Uncharacterized protein n=1 Tax=Tengunoibacter tsumagoiensis TaxID=2014871 RepID=A0A402A1H2_9CHLR|nr:hypothetical protein [Tengunoibacter tsumagoiensis]GCE12906.1 hypothetical protein KTT_27650 [Tengunoibacter tsumagoiensis]